LLIAITGKIWNGLFNYLGEKTLNILEMLAANEEAVANLYRAYASRFNEYGTLWNHMAEEEIVHAEIIREFSKEVEQGLGQINEKRFNKEAFNAYSNYIKRELDAVHEDRLSLMHALSTAFYIEQSLIEARFFEAFEGGSEKIKKLLNQYKSHEKEHIEHVRKVMSEHKQSYDE